MNRNQGFTLIELLLVMIIMGILLLIGTGTFISSLQKGRDTTRKANLRAISSALELYYNDKGKYPVGTGSISGCYIDLTPTATTGTCGKDYTTGTLYPVFQDPTVPNRAGALYMAKFPIDPVSKQRYYYVSDPLGKQYQIYAHLENGQDPAIMPTPPSGTDCGTGTPCNWGLSSANTNP
jgi:prepilin-type N-terminal cleavage/methylation domain-containing protein